MPVAYITCPRCCGASLTCSKCHGRKGGAPIYRCPQVALEPGYAQVVQWSSLAEQGHLPGPGSWGEQSAWLTRAILYLRAEVSRIESERAKEMEAEIRRGAS